jgi:hypothetical protein
MGEPYRDAALRQLLTKDICNALQEYSARKDNHLRRAGEEDRIDDKTVFIIKRNRKGPDIATVTKQL